MTMRDLTPGQSGRNSDLSEDQLVKVIKTHIAKGDMAAEKSEQHYIAAGQHLKTLKDAHTGTWAEWEDLLKTKIGIGKSRASELMQIADGRKTVVQVRDSAAVRMKKLRATSPSRDGETEIRAAAGCSTIDAPSYTAPAFIRNAPDPAAEAFEIIRHMSCRQWQRLIYLMDKHELLPVKGSKEGNFIIEAGRQQIEARAPASNDDGLDIPADLRRSTS
jgi:hypothetical protein